MSRLILLLALICLAATAWTDEPPETRVVNDGMLILQGVPEIPDDMVARLRQYQSVRSASLVGWTRNGRNLFIRTRLDDTVQVHRVYSPGGARQQTTYFGAPVGRVVRRPGSDELVIQMDSDGAEQDQLILFDPQTARSRRLSAPDTRNRLVTWDDQGKRFAFQSTRRNGRTNDLWIMEPGRPDDARLLLEAEPGTWWGPADFSRDGRHLLVQQFLNVDDSRIYRLDLETGELELVAGGEEFPTANRALAIDQDSDGFYYISNARGRAAELVWKSFESTEDQSPEIRILSRDLPWDVSGFTLSPDGKRAAFVTNEHGVSRLYLMNAQKERFSLIRNLPVGIIANMQFSPDSNRLALNLSTAQTPNDVYVLEINRRGRARSLDRWTFSEVGGLDTNGFIEPKLVHYPTFDLVKEKPRHIPAFIYRAPQKGPRPVIIYVHGGPENQYRPSFNSTFQLWIAELGATVIAPNIRGSTGYDSHYLALDNGYRREDAVRDIGALLDWIATQEDLDANRVAIYGGSYGGYVTLASAVKYSDRLRAGVSVVGISDLVTFLENTEDYRRELRRHEYGDERDPEMRAFLKSISPLTNVDQIHIPMMVVQGRNDPRVPAAQSERIVRALREQGQDVWYIEALNEGHGYVRRENQDVYEQAAVLFLKQHL